ncbi:MAG: hypothetical protein GC157_10825 [Frankiales bacterium]|nr:hypothetical protein [Frankiales bacterium]
MSDTRQAGPRPVPAPDDLVLGRYRLVDRVADADGSTLWRATDERLHRPVSVRLTPLESPTCARLRDAAIAASTVSDRRAVPVLDIVEDPGCGCLVVVTEWITGTTLGETLAARGGDPLPPVDAAALALEVSRYLGAAHAAGVTHGRVRPRSVIITDAGEVRVRGLGVDQALYGVEPDLEPRLADVHAVGAVLFAGLTGRWPARAGSDPLPGVPPLPGGRTPSPGLVVADVPADLDLIAARALQTATPPKGLAHYTSAEECTADLSSALAIPVTAPAVRGRGRTVVRVVGVVLAMLSAVGLALLGATMVLGYGGDPLTTPRTDAPTATAPTSASPTSAPPVVTGDQVLPVIKANDYDPYGNKSENPGQLKYAIDKDPATAWTTIHYSSPTMGSKRGVGISLDLGIARPVSGIKLRLVGNGTDLVLYATSDPAKPITTFTKMATSKGAGNQLTIRVPTPVTTRYLVVFLTRLPAAAVGFQGGIADVQVLG